MSPPEPAPTQRQIAVHEAGHALVAHALGKTIDVVEMFARDGSAARVRLVDDADAAVAFAGVAAQLRLDTGWSTAQFQSDLNKAQSLDGDASQAGSIVRRHESALQDLSDWLEARIGEGIAGEGVHAFLVELGVPKAGG